MPLIGLLVALLVLCVVYWVASQLMTAFGVGDPIRTVVLVILVLIALVWLLGFIGVMPMGHFRLT
jgi:hypothetical protein